MDDTEINRIMAIIMDVFEYIISYKDDIDKLEKEVMALRLILRLQEDDGE